ncbi:MAG: serine/threonine protein kinase [Myxococcales bacterium]|nr:serine/threonine protein kinase [Myxococcales bacterium]
MAQQQRYRVLEKIASGGMAEVFRAESAGLEGFKKTVAIKRVLPHLSEKKQFIGMFLDEARLSAHLSHSNCVQVFDIGVGDNTYFIVMEYVDGADLKAIIDQARRGGKPFPLELAALICLRICEGLSYAHEASDGHGHTLGIVHRDMSPPNVLITRHGEVKIVDFGLAKANSQLEKSEPGIIKGKFSYLSPEAALGQPIDHRTDIFAVGIILWEMLAGRRLFLGDSDLDTVRQVQAARIPPIKQFHPHATAELDRVLAKALARDPAQRYQSARDLGRDLNDLLFHSGHPVSSFDIAALVEPIVRSREDVKQRDKKKSIIGSLIEEALFEFTSLQGGDSADRSSAEIGAAPLNIGSFDGQPDWGSQIGLDPASTPAPGASPASFELGNLAALEDDTLSGRHRTPSGAPGPMSSGPSSAVVLNSPPSGPLPQFQQQQPLSMPAPPKSGGKGGLIAFFLVLVLIGGVVGAYFAGVLPPSITGLLKR